MPKATKKQTVGGDEAVEMVMGMLENIDDETLATVLGLTLNVPVKLLDDDSFEITWEKTDA